MSAAQWPESYTLEDLRWMCDCAMRTLVEKYGFSAHDFSRADGEETIYATPNLVHPESDHPRLCAYCEPLPGTMLHWSFDYFGEGDCAPAIQVLDEVEFRSEFVPEDKL